jgi:hypothetical protein
MRTLRDVEDMEGYEKKDWEELKKWGQSEQRYRESDLDRLAEEMAEKGGVVRREQYGKYVLSFDRILRYLNQHSGGGEADLHQGVSKGDARAGGPPALQTEPGEEV